MIPRARWDLPQKRGQLPSVAAVPLLKRLLRVYS